MYQSPSMSFLIHESAEEYHAKAKHHASKGAWHRIQGQPGRVSLAFRRASKGAWHRIQGQSLPCKTGSLR